MPLNKLPDRNLDLERRIWNGQSENLKKIADFEDETESLRDKNLKKEREINDFLTQICSLSVQVNLFQKPSFLHQLTHNMARDCSLIPLKNTSLKHVVYKYCFECQNKNKKTFLYTTCS